MSEKMTAIEAGPSGLNLYGHHPRPYAVEQCRRSWEWALAEAQAVLAALDAGEERVFHQRGIHVIRDRVELPKDGTDA